MDKINQKDTIFTIVSKYPDFVKVMEAIGFSDIAKPGMLQSAGRFMTLEKGAKLKGIDMKEIKEVLNANGYSLNEEEE